MASPPPQDGHDQSSSLVHRQKRRGGALSCAECRRLKLKCSRVFPCSNCVKKGCGAICPEGSLTTGKGNRFVLANTEDLHDKIGQLATRVRQLEDALQQSHSLASTTRHPLLTDDLLQIKRPLERERLDVPPIKEDKAEQNDTIKAIGSLSISQSGKSSFFGQAANSWYLLRNEEGSEEDEAGAKFEPPMPTDIPWLAYAFPFTSVGQTAEAVRSSLITLLPGRNVAQYLCDIYYRHAAWMYTPIAEQDFFNTVFFPVYDQGAASTSLLSSHNLSLLFMVLAMGTLLDLDRPAHSPESMQYYQLGRAALSIESIMEEQSIPAIQALLLMCHFMFLNHIEEPRWVLMGIVVKLAQSVGLHRDSSKWKLDSEEAHRRQSLLWEIYVYDLWQSQTFGRPPSFSLAHIDSKMPYGRTKNNAGEDDMSFAAWKHSFTSECMSVIQDKAFGAQSPSYKTIQELDRKVRLFYVPPSLQVPGFGGARIGSEARTEHPSVELTMQRYVAFAIKEITLFYMHRGFFAHALEEHPQDPMGSKYAPSVLATYTGACTFVALIESLYKQHPKLTERMWFLFTHVFSCSIVLGSIAVKTQMAIAPSALSHLDAAYNLFGQVSETHRAAKILPILRKFRERARSALSNPASPGSPTETQSSETSVKTEAEELVALGGTRLVSRRKSVSPSSPTVSTSSPGSQSASPPPLLVQQDQATLFPVTPQEWQPYPNVQSYAPFTPYPQHTPHSPQQFLHQQVPMHGPNIGPESIPDYYGYTNQTVARSPYDPYEMFSQQQTMANADFMNMPDIQTSWQNLVAQYR